MLTGMHHVGLVVEDYESTVAFYRDVLGGTVTETGDVEGLVDVAFVELPDSRVEVIARHSRGTYLDELLDALLEASPYHVAYVVDDIHEAMTTLEEAGYGMFDEEPVEGIGPYVRAFVDPGAVPGPPVELVEMREA